MKATAFLDKLHQNFFVKVRLSCTLDGIHPLTKPNPCHFSPKMQLSLKVALRTSTGGFLSSVKPNLRLFDIMVRARYS